MDAIREYTEGTARLEEGRYLAAEKHLTRIASSAAPLGTMALYWLSRSFHLRALHAGRCGDLAAAKRYLSIAASLTGGRLDWAGYLAGLYASTVAPPVEPGAEPDPAERIEADAVRLNRRGRTSEALLMVYRAIRREPASAKLHLLAGLLLAGENRNAEARRHWLKAVDRDCTCAEAHRCLGLAAASEGRFDQAVGRLQRALLQRPWDVSLTRELLTVASAGGSERPRLTLPDAAGLIDPDALERLAGRAMADPDWPTAFFDLPSASGEAELFGLLATVLDRVLSLHDDYADIHHRRARLAERLGRTDEAIDHASRAVQINETYVAGRFHLGRLLLPSDPTAAAEHLAQAVAAGGDYADVHAALATAYQKLGRIEAAREHWARSLEINSDYAPAREALECLAA